MSEFQITDTPALESDIAATLATPVTGIPQSTANPLLDVFGQPDYRDDHEKAMDTWRQESFTALDAAVIDPKSYGDERVPSGYTPDEWRKTRVVDDWMRLHTDGEEPPMGLSREFTRARLAEQVFGGAGAENDDALYGEITKAATGRKDEKDLARELTVAAFDDAMLPSDQAPGFTGFREKLKAHAGYRAENGADYVEAWHETRRAAKDKVDEFREPLVQVWRAFKTDGNVTAAAYDAYSKLTPEQRPQFMDALAIRARALPDAERATFWANMGQQTGLAVSDYGRNAAEAATSNMQQGGTVGWEDFLGSNEAVAARKASDAKSLADFQQARNFAADVRKVAREDYDPLQSAFGEGKPGFWEGVAYQAPGVTVTSMSMAIPYVGVATMAFSMEGQAYEGLRGRMMAGGLDDATASAYAEGIAPFVALPQAALEKVGFAIWSRKLPGFSKVMDTLGDKIANRALRFGAKTLTIGTAETGIELLQDATEYAVQDIAAALTEDVPDVDWSKELSGTWAQAPEIFATMLPLAILGAAGGLNAESRQAAFARSSQTELEAYGINPEGIAAIQGAQGPASLAAAIDSAMETRDPNTEAAAAAVAELKQKAASQRQAVADLERLGYAAPTFTTTPEGVFVFDAEGNELGMAQNYAGASRIAAAHTTALVNMEQDRVDALTSLMEGVKAAVSLDKTSEMEVNFGEFDPAQATPGKAAQFARQVALKETAEGGTGDIARSVLGYSTTEMAQGVRHTVNRLFKNASIVTAFHETGHGLRRKAHAAGTVTIAMEASLLINQDAVYAGRQVRDERGKQTGDKLRLVPEGITAAMLETGEIPAEMIPAAFHGDGRRYADTILDEGVSQILEAEVLKLRKGQARGKLGITRELVQKNLQAMARLNATDAKSWKSFFAAVRGHWGLAMSRAVAMAGAERRGEFDPAERDAYLDKLLGLDQQTEHDAGVQDEFSRMLAGFDDVDMEEDDIPFSIGRASVTPTATTRSFQGAEGSPSVIGPAAFSIGAYHGTPHQVDKFRTDKIGTGEGAQAYGWGLYFAESEKVAEEYRKILGSEFRMDGEIFLKSGNFGPAHRRIYDDLGEEAADILVAFIDKGKARVIDELNNPLNQIDQATFDRAADFLDRIEATNSGNLYRVTLKVDDEDLLDWDKPLSEQSEKVRAAILSQMPEKSWAVMENKTGQSYYEFYWNARSAGMEGDIAGASRSIAKLGIRGIRYLDGNSRADGEGSYNYVVFDEADIEILEENGTPVDLGEGAFSIGRAVTIGARPGEYGWTPGGIAATEKQKRALDEELAELQNDPVSNEDRIKEVEQELRGIASKTTPAPVTHPTQKEPRLERVGAAAQKILRTPKVKRLFADLIGLADVKIQPTLGSWLGNIEPSFVMSAENMTDDQAADLGALMGFAWAQDATIVGRPNESLTEGIPAYFIGNKKALQRKTLDVIFAEAQKRGIDFATTPDGKSVQFLFFGDETELHEFTAQISAIQKSAGLTESHHELVSSDLNETQTDYSSADGSGRQAAWFQATPEGFALFERIVSDLVAPYAKAIGSEGYRFNVDLFAKRFGLSETQAGMVADALYPSNGKLKSAVPVMDGTVDLGVEGVTTKKGRFVSSVTNVVWALQNWSAQFGLIAPGDYSPRAGKLIAQTIADEVAWHVNKAKELGKRSAIGWYDRALKSAKRIYAGMFPELEEGGANYDADKALVFDAILGIASQGNDVTSNSVMSVRVFANWRRGGMTVTEAVAPVTKTFGQKTVAIENNFEKLDELLRNNTYAELRKFLNKKDTVGNINAYLRKNKKFWFNGKPLSVEGAAAQKVTGWMVFGPKIGSFINNLHGDYSTLTADLWFSRTWNRILGWSFIHSPEREATNYLAMRDALVAEYTNDDSIRKYEKGNPIYWDHGTDVTDLTPEEFDDLVNDPEKMLELAKVLEERFRKSQYKEKSALRRAGKTWIENRENVQEAPRTDLEREFQQSTMEKAQKILKRMGIDINIADMQAALWYNEKDLYATLGSTTKLSAPADYADAAATTYERIRSGTLYERMGEEAKSGKGGPSLPQRMASKEFESEIFQGIDLPALKSSLDEAEPAFSIGGAKAGGFEKAKAEGRTFTGKDGKERFELDASQAAFNPSAIKDPAHRNGFKRLGADSPIRWLVPEDMDTPLGNILAFDELYENYPQLAGLKVNLHHGDPSTFGSFARVEINGKISLGFSTIYLSDKLTAGQAFSTLLHEVQHAIQQVEGFSPGSSPEAETKEYNRLRARYNGIHSSDEMREYERKTEEVFQKYDRDEITAEEMHATIQALGKSDPAYKELLQVTEELQSMSHGMGEFKAHRAYRNRPGEKEARGVQARQSMTAEERAATPFMDQWGSFSLGPAQVAGILSDNALARITDPRRRTYVMSRIARDFNAMRLQIERITSLSGIRRSKGDLRREAMAREDLAAEEKIAAIHQRFGEIMADEDLVKIKSQPVHSFLSDPTTPLRGRVMSKRQAIKNHPDVFQLHRAGDYDGSDGVSRSVFGGQRMPDQAAQELFDEGLISEPTADAMWEALLVEQKTVAGMKEMLAKATDEIRAAKAEAKQEANEWLATQGKDQEVNFSDKEEIRRSLRMLDAILLALPAEIRGKIGGYTQISMIASDDARLAYLKDKLAKADKELEDFLRVEYAKEWEELLKKAAPKTNEAGQRPTGSIAADAYDVFRVAEHAMGLSFAEGEAEADKWDAIADHPDTDPKDVDLARVKAQMIRLTMNWPAADAARREQAVLEGDKIYFGGLRALAIENSRRRERLGKLRDSAVRGTGKTGHRMEREAAKQATATKLGAVKAMAWEFLSFGQVVNVLFGEKSDAARWMNSREIAASNGAHDGFQAKANALESLFDTLSGNRFDGEKLRHRMATDPRIKVKDVLGVDHTFTESQAIDFLLTYRQEDGKRHMHGIIDDSGAILSEWAWDDQSAATIEAGLSAEGRAAMAFLGHSYGEEYSRINAVFRRIWNVMMPRHKMYAPISAKPVQGKGDTIMDPQSGDTMGTGMTPGSLKNRSFSAISEIEFKDAFQKYLQHARQMEHFIAYAEFSRDALGIINRRETRNAIEAAGGADAAATLSKWVDYFALGGIHGAAMGGAWTKILGGMLGRLSQAALVGRVSVLCMQSLQLAAASFKMPTGAFLTRFAKLSAGRLQWGDTIQSEYIQRRLQQLPPVVRDMMAGMASGTPNRAKYLAGQMGRSIAGADALFTAGTYAIFYDYHLGLAKKAGIANPEAHAHAEAERFTDQVAQPVRTGARSWLEVANAGNPAFRAAWNYSSDPRQKMSMLVYAAMRRDTSGKKKAGDVAFTAAKLWIVGGVLQTLMRTVLRDLRNDDDDEIFDERYWSPARLALQVGTGPLGAVPFLGGMMEDATYKLTGQFAPQGGMLAFLDQAAGLPQKWAGGKIDPIKDAETLTTAGAGFSGTSAAAASAMHILRDVVGFIENLEGPD